MCGNARIEESAFQDVKREIEFSLYGMEMNSVLEPMGRVLWRVTNSASSRVLFPVLDGLTAQNEIEEIVKAA
ncbi:hypothetical protein GCM10011273_15970 [Asticcacaulis endophyticus]|uniref:Uncharacterized protein n=1 Tax=Asticcacaulis endophyticus TaxID=1395890 RepID=A0A918Q285_9CAUL|nr:hypothetical protein GCM10011273_15970 [Asticcacaulis endophyticus]